MINKKIVLSVLTIAFISVAAAGTWAEYTGNVQSTGNSFESGTVSLAIANEIGSHTVLKPGTTITPNSITFTYTGSIPAGTIDLAFAVTDNDLSRALTLSQVGTLTSKGDAATTTSGTTLWSFNGQTAHIPLTHPLVNGDTVTVTFTDLQLPLAASTGQGQHTDLLTTITATQTV